MHTYAWSNVTHELNLSSSSWFLINMMHVQKKSNHYYRRSVLARTEPCIFTSSQVTTQVDYNNDMNIEQKDFLWLRYQKKSFLLQKNVIPDDKQEQKIS
jgi:hypothetical protein